MLRALWEDNDALSDAMKVHLRERDAADLGIKACMASDYPVRSRVKVEGSHKGRPHSIYGVVMAHRTEMGVVEVEVENELTGHLRRFSILTAKITPAPAVPKVDPNQAAIDAFMASEQDADGVEMDEVDRQEDAENQ